MQIRQKAFTLIELLVTLTVVGIILGTAIPSFNKMVLDHRSIGISEDLATAFNFARSEAVKRSARVSVCISDNGFTCSTGTNWRVGFIAYVDLAGDASATTNPDIARILRIWPAQDSRALITVKRGATNITFVRYSGTGVLGRVGNSNAAITVESKLNGCTGDSARIISISVSGQINIQKTNC